MRELTIIYSDQNPRNSEPSMVRVVGSVSESIDAIMNRYDIDFYKIHYVIEGHPPIEGDASESCDRRKHAHSVYSELLNDDLEYRYEWCVFLREVIYNNICDIDKAHDIAVDIMYRLFDIPYMQLLWYGVDDVCHENAVCEVVVDSIAHSSKITTAFYSGGVWRDIETNHEVSVLLWRYV